MIPKRPGMAQRQYGERGDGLVEFAAVLPVLMLILIAILDLGRAVYAYNVVANCAREGARYGIVAPTNQAGIIAAAKNAAIGLDPTQLTVSVAYPDANTIQVSASYTFKLVTPLVSQAIGGGTLVLRSATTMYRGY